MKNVIIFDSYAEFVDSIYAELLEDHRVNLRDLSWSGSAQTLKTLGLFGCEPNLQDNLYLKNNSNLYAIYDIIDDNAAADVVSDLLIKHQSNKLRDKFQIQVDYDLLDGEDKTQPSNTATIRLQLVNAAPALPDIPTPTLPKLLVPTRKIGGHPYQPHNLGKKLVTFPDGSKHFIDPKNMKS